MARQINKQTIDQNSTDFSADSTLKKVTLKQKTILGCKNLEEISKNKTRIEKKGKHKHKFIQDIVTWGEKDENYSWTGNINFHQKS